MTAYSTLKLIFNQKLRATCFKAFYDIHFLNCKQGVLDYFLSACSSSLNESQTAILKKIKIAVSTTQFSLERLEHLYMMWLPLLWCFRETAHNKSLCPDHVHHSKDIFCWNDIPYCSNVHRVYLG